MNFLRSHPFDPDAGSWLQTWLESWTMICLAIVSLIYSTNTWLTKKKKKCKVSVDEIWFLGLSFEIENPNGKHPILPGYTSRKGSWPGTRSRDAPPVTWYSWPLLGARWVALPGWGRGWGWSWGKNRVENWGEKWLWRKKVNFVISETTRFGEVSKLVCVWFQKATVEALITCVTPQSFFFFFFLHHIRTSLYVYRPWTAGIISNSRPITSANATQFMKVFLLPGWKLQKGTIRRKSLIFCEVVIFSCIDWKDLGLQNNWLKKSRWYQNFLIEGVSFPCPCAEIMLSACKDLHVSRRKKIATP